MFPFLQENYMTHNSLNSAGKLLISVLPKWLVILIAVLSLVLVAGLLAWGILNPNFFESEFTRFMLCLGLSLFMGFFLFVAYPWDYRMTKIPRIQISMEIVGPAALILFLVCFLDAWMPSPTTGRLHKFTDQNNNAVLTDIQHIKMNFDEANEPVYYWVLDKNGTSFHGVYIIYPENKQSLSADIQPSYQYKAERVDLNRRDEVYKLKLDPEKSLKKE
jgi:hypothetical protein